MRRGGRLALAAASLLAAPGQAQAPASDWIDKKARPPRPKLVDIRVPRTAAGASLSSLRSFRPGGEDVVASYLSPDGEVFGTVYIYRPSLPDAALAAIATDAVIASSYGAAMRTRPEAIGAAGGVAGAAYVSRFDNLNYKDKPGISLGAKASYAAFVRAGAWIVKLRVSGPEPRRDEVLALGDALLAGVAFGKDARPVAAPPYELGDCPADPAIVPAAARVAQPGDRTMTELIVATAAVAAAPVGTTESERYCTSGRATAAGPFPLILSHAGGSRERPDLVLLGDAGDAVQTLDGIEATGGHVWVVLHRVGGATVFGPFDRRPSLDQYRDLTEGRGDWLGAPAAHVGHTARGGPSIELDSAILTPKKP